MIYKMKLLEREFNRIIYDDKRFEVRLCDEKRNKLKVGDKINFYKLPDLNDFILVEIIKIYKFKTFRDVYDNFPQECFGYKNLTKEKILNNIYNIYSTKEEIALGVMVINFKLIN